MKLTVILVLFMAAGAGAQDAASGIELWSKMKPIRPRGYVCYRAAGPIRIDGRADEPAWAEAPWTENFVDIEDGGKPPPRFRTRAKMLWDDRYLYVYVELEEPHVWATIRKKNEVIFYDNDFEVFINPDGNNHNYYEYEMNAFNTIWELTLDKPYKDGGPAHLGTNLEGLVSAVHVKGTINNPTDTDRGWSVEVAVPFKGLKKYATNVPCPPVDGEQWRIDFSRVEWLVDIIDGKYRKIPREARPEDNWVWSPTGIIDMHRPERWGYIQFSSRQSGTDHFHRDPTLPARDLLMEVYYRQRDFQKQHGRYAASLADLAMTGPAPSPIEGPVDLATTDIGYVASVKIGLPDGPSQLLHVREDSKLWGD